MQWSDVTKAPSAQVLRQFAGLCLVVLPALAGWRLWRLGPDTPALLLAGVGLGIGLVGLVRPAAVRWIYSGWMIVAFPIGWTLSRVALAVVYYLVITPVAVVFRFAGRDVLRLKRGRPGETYWTPKPRPRDVRDYFRQS